MDIKDITYRHIAIMLVKSLPVKDKDFTAEVEEYLVTIKALPKAAKVALKSAYIFSAKVPWEEREDAFQDLALAVLKARTSDDRLGYAIARCDWKNWWRQYKIRQHYSLDSVIEDEDGSPATMAELLVGEAEFEIKMNGKLDAKRIWNKLPENIKPIIRSRIIGQALTGAQRVSLHRWTKTSGYQVLLASV